MPVTQWEVVQGRELPKGPEATCGHPFSPHLFRHPQLTAPVWAGCPCAWPPPEAQGKQKGKRSQSHDEKLWEGQEEGCRAGQGLPGSRG